MEAVNKPARRWSMIVQIMEDEARHRHANEFANAMAAMHLAKAALPTPSPIMEGAIARLNAQVRIERLILLPDTSYAGKALADLCGLIAKARACPDQIAFTISEPSLMLGEGLLRTLLKITYELVTNAVRHSHETDATVFVSLVPRGAGIDLIVRNRLATSLREEDRKGSGLMIARRLTAIHGGRLTSCLDGSDHVARARLPLG